MADMLPDNDGRLSSETNGSKLVLPVPPGFPLPELAENGAAPSDRWDYHDEDGQVLFSVCRFDHGTGKKIIPLTLWQGLDGGLSWHYKSVPAPRPLFNLHFLKARPDSPILVVEGEKAAMAAAKIFPDLVAITSSNGSKAADQTNWSPLADRSVIIWPDNDDAGRAYAADVCRLARNVGARQVVIVTVPEDFPPKWDLADPLPDRYAPGDLRKLIDEAEEPAGEEQEAMRAFAIEWFKDIGPSVGGIDLVADLLGIRQMSVVYGASNTGKTFLALDIGLHVALGWPWFGRIVEPGGVIYVAAEGGRGVSNRIAAFRRYYGLGDDEDPPFAVVNRGVNLCESPTDTDALIATITAAACTINMPVTLIIIDTLSRAMAGGNENSSDDMGALVASADRLREETGAHVMFIHHSGKDATRGARGHSLLRAAVDTEIEVQRHQTADHALARVTKQRELPCEGEFVYLLDVVELGVSERGKSVTSAVVRPAGNVSAPEAANTQDRQISASSERALEVLRDCIASRVLDLDIDIPSDRMIKLEDWRKALRRAGVTNEAKPDSERSLWSRYRKELLAAGAVVMDDEYVGLSVFGEIENGQSSDLGSAKRDSETPLKRGVSLSQVSSGRVPEDFDGDGTERVTTGEGSGDRIFLRRYRRSRTPMFTALS